MPSEPLEDDALDEMRDYALGTTPTSPAGVEMSHADAVDAARIMVGWLVGEVDRLRAENAELAAARAELSDAMTVAYEAMNTLSEKGGEAVRERDALAAKLEAVRAIEPTLRRIYATGIASEREVIDVVDELIGQALRESATTPPEEALMPDETRETADNVQDKLTAAEQAAYTPIYEGAHHADHAMLVLRPGKNCPRCVMTSRAVVEAVRQSAEGQADAGRDVRALVRALDEGPESATTPPEGGTHA